MSRDGFCETGFGLLVLAHATTNPHKAKACSTKTDRIGSSK